MANKWGRDEGDYQREKERNLLKEVNSQLDSLSKPAGPLDQFTKLINSANSKLQQQAASQAGSVGKTASQKTTTVGQSSTSLTQAAQAALAQQFPWLAPRAAPQGAQAQQPQQQQIPYAQPHPGLTAAALQPGPGGVRQPSPMQGPNLFQRFQDLIQGLSDSLDDPRRLHAEGSQVGGRKGKAMQAGAHVLQGFREHAEGGGPTPELGGAAEFARAGGKAAGMVPGIGAVAGPVMGFAGAVIEASNSLIKWNQRLRESDQILAQVSPGMAQTEARQQVRDIRYNRERGEARSESADARNEAVQGLKDVLAPLGDAVSNIANYTVKLGANALQAVGSGFGLWGKAPWESDTKSKDEDKRMGGRGLSEWMAEEGDAQWQRRYGAPARFGGPRLWD